MLLPRLTLAEIVAVPNPTSGLVVFCTTDSKLYIYNATALQWKEVAFGTGAISPPPFVCGNSITIDHVAGTVAPVSKSVTYGTITNITGEPSKCWITSNLGADHQAADVNDGTEESAGWYWQFDRKQGYEHDGTTRTPNTIWISSISGNTNWNASNDPCTIELGTGWHVPSASEWDNIINSNNWTNWHDVWNSGLKIHGAAYLDLTDGSLTERGVEGYYCTNTMSSRGPEYSYFVYFNDFACYITDRGNRADAYAMRCVKDESSPISLPAVTTSLLTNITTTAATSGGDVTSDGGATVNVRGVCWSTSSNPTLANSYTNDGSGTGTFVSSITGLATNTLYYVRSYATNSEGTAYGNEVSFTTLPVFTCGSSITINHVAGSVAPVTKTVTYGTVTNIPGETTKCWITSNLGADHQATAKTDATEASAGWYWQFNRQQGYMHDGSIRTPAITWISSIDENSGWVAANDPCTLEFGNGWRIPTGTEWGNVDAAGNWTSANGPWNSALKLHQAGSLHFSDGSLQSRGTGGSQWSTDMDFTTTAWLLGFSTGCNMNSYNKAFAVSVRCIKN